MIHVAILRPWQIQVITGRDGPCLKQRIRIRTCLNPPETPFFRAGSAKQFAASYEATTGLVTWDNAKALEQSESESITIAVVSAYLIRVIVVVAGSTTCSACPAGQYSNQAGCCAVATHRDHAFKQSLYWWELRRAAWERVFFNDFKKSLATISRYKTMGSVFKQSNSASASMILQLKSSCPLYW